jgi:LCP family protein required for cell wall assembly
MRGFIWGGAFTLTAMISGLIGVTVALKSSLPINLTPILEPIQALKEHGLSSLFFPVLETPINVLVMGIDRVADAQSSSADMFGGRSDTILLVRFQPQDRSIRILSIPRDSRVTIPGLGYDKINSANARGGVDLITEVLSQNLNNVTIHRYVRVTTDAFRELVDLVGGVEVYVPYDMQYTDVTQKLEIKLKQGKQTLNGEQAEQFARFRNDSLGDIGRVQRQQILIKALGKKLQSPRIIIRIPQLRQLLQKQIDTNLTKQEILSLAAFCQGLDKENIKMVMLPGHYSRPEEYNLSYWIISSPEKNQVMEQYFELNSDSNGAYRYTRHSLNRIRIAIQNGTPNPELPVAVAKYLEKRDFRHVYLSKNSSLPTQTTQIIAQQGDYKSAQMLQRILAFGEVDASSTGDLNSDLTIRVGADAQQLLEGNSFTR